MDPSNKKEKDQVHIVEKVKRPHRDSDLSDQLGDAHFNILPQRRIITILLILALANLVSFADQTGITVGLSAIASDLNSEKTINWAGTASLLANCVCQILFGRLSDIFGRKNVLMWCLAILIIGQVACSTARNGPEFYVFRALAGIGNGGVSSLGMVILSDIVSLKDRGKYQGILGASVGLGNIVGPFVMSAFVKHYSWRGFYYLFAPLGCLVNVAIYFTIDGNTKLDGVLSKKEKFKKIDYLGIIIASIALTCLLVAISGSGTSFPWDSKLTITLFCVGGIAFIVFFLVEWKIPELPMIPLRLFKSPSMCLLFASTFLFGATYFSLLYYLPYYFQIVRSKSEIQTSVFIVPLVAAQALMSIVGGQIITLTGHYFFVVCGGYALWLTGCGLLIIWNEHTSDGVLVVVMLIIGTGVGFSFQPSMVAIQANCKKAERAVAISTRNVLRSFGGAIGIASGSTMISNTLLNHLAQIQGQSDLTEATIDYLKDHIYSKINLAGVSASEITTISQLYISALRYYYYLIVTFMGICLVCSIFVKDRGLQCTDEHPVRTRKDLESSASSYTVNS
ncbi:MFS efflux transporter [Scheffersomyces stipitis CBS 6054]|uniref:MFS efflux transporter n=1 Tax=Scheffersomyces stipitis (strain ATCC 58785 / CBS 6054 / NBRC 10063 / NRRL Y-11545) TaxID=322104 RepID=A3GH02_PICST|nr:MFS efflux transporter [Scheffersomyces stipitis CBS 6054]EAZ63624.2 MFS efflux transporter [Scheffersomyces stipitis CBS 6054]